MNQPRDPSDTSGEAENLRYFFFAAFVVVLICGVLALLFDSEGSGGIGSPSVDGGKLVLERLPPESMVAAEAEAQVPGIEMPKVVEVESELVNEVVGLRRWRVDEPKPAPTNMDVRGFRGDGSGAHSWDKPVVEWSKTKNVEWVRPMSEWSNSSPVVVAGRVFTTAEPFTLMCLDSETGETLWHEEVDIASTLSEEEGDDLRSRLAGIVSLSEELEGKQRKLYRLKRSLRKKSGDPGLVAKMEVLEAEVNTLRDRVAELDRFRSPPPMEFIGYGASTPVTDGEFIYAVFGNGVVSRFDLDGNRQWSTWLGDPVRPMNGNDRGHASSPLLKNGVLVVSYGNVMALDATSGALLWRAPNAFRDFGTSALMRLGSRDVIVTPNGELFDLQSGELVLEAVDNLFYMGPHVDGERAFFFGASTLAEANREEDCMGQVVQFKQEGSGKATSTKLWETLLGDSYIFSSPVTYSGKVFHVSGEGTLKVFNAEVGTLEHIEDLHAIVEEPMEAYPSPIIAGGYLYITSEAGTTVVFDPMQTKVVAVNKLEEKMRSTPTFSDGHFYIRTFDNLYKIGED